MPALVLDFEGKKGKKASEGDSEDTALDDAGMALKEALDSGDGRAIYDAFETLKTLCEGRELEGETDEEEY